MRIISKNPTKAYLYDFTEKDIENLKKELSFKYTSVSYLIRNHYKKSWLKQKSYAAWATQLEELKEQESGSVLQKDSNGWYIRPGYLTYLKNRYDFSNQVEYPSLKKIPWKNALSFEPYDYQKYSVEKLLEAKHGAVSLPTGAGKTAIIHLLVRNSGLKTVIVTPSKSIFLELYESFVHLFGDKYVGSFGNGKKDIKKQITIAIGKSLTSIKSKTKEEDFFKDKEMVIVDESHSWATDDLERVCHGIFSDTPYRFYMSGTQIRNDGGTKILHSIIGPIVYEMSLEDAIKKQYLCPLKFNIISVGTSSNSRSTDPLTVKREHFLRNTKIGDVISTMCNAIVTVKNQSCLILVEELEQISYLKDKLTVPFTYIHGDAGNGCKESGLNKVDLKKELERFNTGEVKVLIGTRSISTGTNIFPTHQVFNWMGGSSEIVTKQGAMGRSTRKLENSKYKDFHQPKPFSNIYDFEVQGQKVLNNQLEKRIGFYQEAGEHINFIKY